MRKAFHATGLFCHAKCRLLEALQCECHCSYQCLDSTRLVIVYLGIPDAREAPKQALTLALYSGPANMQLIIRRVRQQVRARLSARMPDKAKEPSGNGCNGEDDRLSEMGNSVLRLRQGSMPRKRRSPWSKISR